MPTEVAYLQEEVFGPFVTVTPFSSEEEVLRLANDMQYGLAGGFWTQDVWFRRE